MHSTDASRIKIESCNRIKLFGNPLKSDSNIMTSVPNSKACVTCNVVKIENEFIRRDGKVLGQCKECRNRYISRYRKERADGIRQKREIIVTNNGKTCISCEQWKLLDEYPRRDTQHGYRNECKDCKRSQLHEYYVSTYNAVRRDKKKNDMEYRILCNHRNYVYKCLTKFSLKHKASMEYIGCTVAQLKLWLERMFISDMSWDNYGTYWTIDHVIPLSFFDLTNPLDQRVAFHWSNMVPSIDNFQKGNNFRPWEYFNTFISAFRFIRNNHYDITWYQGVCESLHWLRKNSGMVKIHWMKMDKSIKMGNPQPSTLSSLY